MVTMTWRMEMRIRRREIDDMMREKLLKVKSMLG